MNILTAILDRLNLIDIQAVTMLIFAGFVGMEIIGKVPTLLHTPLMSGANAISGVTVVGGIYLVRTAAVGNWVPMVLGALAVFLGMINVVGGFAVTNRMLDKFRRTDSKPTTKGKGGAA